MITKGRQFYALIVKTLKIHVFCKMCRDVPKVEAGGWYTTLRPHISQYFINNCLILFQKHLLDHVFIQRDCLEFKKSDKIK